MDPICEHVVASDVDDLFAASVDFTSSDWGVVVAC